ncbi:hypothetical protein [Actinoallomurus sp. NPDC052274]|uniref:hypothetical protein n=1 Tax=Actinoallomurus sp. NPDC052274 TaxID=3155420 RepID=UPI00342E601A
MNRKWDDVKREAAQIREEQGREFTDEMRAVIRRQMLDEIHAYEPASATTLASSPEPERCGSLAIAALYRQRWPGIRW